MTNPNSSPARYRTGSLGCLGVFSVFCLTVFTLIEVGLLLRMNPDWFDRRVAFWRPAPFTDGPVFVTDAESRARIAAEDVLEPPPKRGTYTSDGIRLYDQRIVEGDYDPSRGLTLNTLEGAKMEFPPGSIREAVRVKVAPVAWVPDQYLNKDLMGVTPCYKILVGDQEHYRFARPVRVTLPYPGDVIKGEGTRDLAIAVSENGPWEILPTTVDPVSKTMSADVTHCSLEWGILLTAKGIAATAAAAAGVGAAVIKNNATANGIWNRGTRLGSSKYTTANFNVFYYTSDASSVPTNFPLSPKKKVPDVPDFVALIAEHLESVRADMNILGLSVESRTNVFLEPISGDAAGESKLGGPMWISTKWDQRGSYPPNDELDRWLRATVAHELYHVAQGKFIGNYSAHQWWVEMTAAYLGDLYWERKKQPTNMVSEYYLPSEDGKLISKPMDVGGQEHFYSYAVFLRWLESRCDTLKLISEVNATGAGSMDQFDAALRKLTKKSLVELLQEFALDYYCNDMRKCALTPAKLFNHSVRTQSRRQSIAGDNFTLLARLSHGGLPHGGLAALNVIERCKVPEIPPRCAVAVKVHVDSLPEMRKAKMVFDLTPASGPTLDPDLIPMIASARTGQLLPSDGEFGSFAPAFDNDMGPRPPDARPRGMRVIDNVFAPAGTDHITLVLFNRSTTKTLPGPEVTRWALLRPEWVSSQRVDKRSIDASARGPASYVSPHWLVTGQESELRGVTSPADVFGGYAVYRRLKGEKDFPSTTGDLFPPSESITSLEMMATDTQEYAWTYASRDKFKNESEKAPSDDVDPFQGTWTGTVTLVEGSLETPAVEMFSRGRRQMQARFDAEMDRLKRTANDPNVLPSERSSALTQINEKTKGHQDDVKMVSKVQEVITGAARYTDALARFGVPVELQVRLIGKDYSARVSKIVLRDTGMPDWIPLERISQHTLEFKPAIDPATTLPRDLPEGMPPLCLRLYRPDEIRDDYLVETELQGTPMRYFVRWHFVRAHKSASPPSPAPRGP